MTPFPLFKEWLDKELNLTKARVPTACCLSTNGTDGYPNARFVSLKEIVDDCFILTGPLSSRKGMEISQSDKVALTFWWTETERQVRVQGVATKISDRLADKYFRERNRDSQIVSIVSEQGQVIESLEVLNEKFRRVDLRTADKNLARPENWGGFSIKPIRIEFLEFKPTRFLDRRLFERIHHQWIIKQIQP